MTYTHATKIKALQTQITDYSIRKVPFRVYHGSTNSTRIVTYKRSEMVDTSAIKHVLSVDTVKKVALVEPNVPMDTLVRETLRYGLVPPVVPEFPGITVGGAIQGAAAESASHRWGCFSQITNWVEMILGDGTIVTASKDEHSDLFYGTAGAYGSLGLITAAEVQLITATKYVNVTHYQIHSFEEGVQMMDKFTLAGCDFIEWVMFSKTYGAIVIGTMSDQKIGTLRRFSRPFDPWYYLYVRSVADAGKPVTDSLPLKDYLFRFNRGAFWAAELAFTQSGIPFNRLTRFYSIQCSAHASCTKPYKRVQPVKNIFAKI